MKTRALIAVVATLAVALLATTVAATASPLDRGFGPGGRALTFFPRVAETDGKVESIAVAADGRVAVAVEGDGGMIHIEMLRADGRLDRGFGAGGSVSPQLEPGRPFRPRPGIIHLAFLGRDLLVAGPSDGPGSTYTIERFEYSRQSQLRMYRPDGRLARSFGEGGVQLIDQGGYGGTLEAMFAGAGGRIFLFAGREIQRLSRQGWRLHTTSLQGGVGSPVMGLDRTFVTALWGVPSRGSFVLARIGTNGQIVNQASRPFGGGRSSTAAILGLQSDGSILATHEGGIGRLESDGVTFDPGFHTVPLRCRLPTPQPDYVREPDNEIQSIEGISAGKILVQSACGIFLLDADGTLDPQFGEGGGLTLEPGPQAMQPIAAGGLVYASWNQREGELEVLRLGPDGNRDPGFGSNGRTLVALGSPASVEANATAAAGGGRVVVAGGTSFDHGFAVVRYLRGGRLDPHFGDRGRVAIHRDNLRSATAVAVGRDGSTYLVGKKGEENAVAIAKLGAAGHLVRSFGNRGIAVRQLDPSESQRSEVSAMALQPDGKIVVAGLTEGKGGLHFLVARLHPNGGLDRSFANGGVFRRRLVGNATARAVAVMPDGRIVVTGGGYGYFVTVRLTARGRLDHSFGHGGIVARQQGEQWGNTVDLGYGADALSVARNGAVTVAGGSGSERTIVERYRPTGRVDRRFGRRGTVRLRRFGVSAMRQTPCGLLLGGSVHLGGAEEQMAVLSIRSAGRRVSNPVRPFGPGRRTRGAALTFTSPGRAVLVGTQRAFRTATRFGVAALRRSVLQPGCR